MAPQVIDRSAFIRRWCDRDRDGDPFDQFFSLWVALVISARPELKDDGAMETDRCAILRLSKGSHTVIFTEIDRCRDDLAWLAQREGTHLGHPIVDVHQFRRSRRSKHLMALFDRLANHYSGRSQAKPGSVVEAVIELLNHVRNNLFHGIKDPEDVDDQELIQRLNPLLRAVLRGAGYYPTES